jgi:hypothetical protein
MTLRMCLLAVAASLPVLARAADREGDLRDLVAIHPPGYAAGRITFGGVGARSRNAEFSAKFDDDRGFPRRFVADFGTELVALSSIRVDGTIGLLALTYTGEPSALRGVVNRWKEVLARAGAYCDADSCHWTDEHGDMIATLNVGSWRGRPEVNVWFER